MAKTLRSEIPDQFGGVINDEALQRCLQVEMEGREQRREINEGLKGNHATVREMGFSVPVFLGIVRELEMEPDVRAALYQAQADLRRRLGALDGTPLGDAAMEREDAVHPAPKRGRKPRSFADQPVHQPRPRGRPRKDAGEALADARLHLGEEEPAGTA